MERVCQIEGCERSVHAKGVCNLHRQRIAIHGDPSAFTPRENRIKHGHARVGRLTPEYYSWASMISRCSDPKNRNYKDYGGRGIRVCERWASFDSFLADMGPRPKGTSLDRYPDQGGNYEPGNCRWATPSEQGNNTRRNVVLEFQGREQTLAQWAREVGINAATLRDRLHRYKWSVERALTAPLRLPTDPRKEKRAS